MREAAGRHRLPGTFTDRQAQRMTLRTASCHCGALVLHCAGAPKKISLCHCLQCQRRTGSLFSVAVFYEREKVTIEQGATGSFERESASGFPVAFRFCPACGSNIFWEPARMPHLIGVAAGAFADPDFPMPVQAVWTSQGHGWLRLPEGIEAFEENPVPRGA